ncbi:MAG: metallophosphoesterase family protein [Elusimicrobiota bacterium]
MLWGVLSDIHSNYAALDAVLKALEQRGARSFICCGDVVGYGPEPNEVVERMAELPSLRCVRGNHDLAVLGRMDISWFNAPAKAAVMYAREVLKKENLAWLKELPPVVEDENFTVVHGSPRNTAEEYLVTVQQFHDNCAYFKTSPCFVGHSHLPVCFLMREPVSYVEAGTLGENQELRTPEGTRSVINPGSVGQPRDQDNRSACGVYDDQRRTFTLYRVPYDIASTQQKIIKAGIPEFLAARLDYGQ